MATVSELFLTIQKEIFMENTKKFWIITTLLFLFSGIAFIGCSDVTKNHAADDITDDVINTTDNVIDIAEIEGVGIPTTGAIPIKTITASDQYTGEVTWGPVVSGTFAAEQVYTATITLTAKTGFTFEGVLEDFFTVDGAETVTNPANSGVITVTFPATEPLSPSFPPPELPVLFENGQWAQVLGKVVASTPFSASSWVYEDGLIRIENGTTGTNAPQWFTFENVVDMRGYGSVIVELEEAPSGWFRSCLRFVVDQDVIWTNTTSADSFNAHIITMKPATGETFGEGASNPANWTLNRFRGVGVIPNAGDSVRIKRVSLGGNGPGAPVAVTSATIPFIAPRTGSFAPKVIHNAGSGQYTGTVKWNPDHPVFQANTNYTATITLTAKSGYHLNSVAANFFSVANAATTTSVVGTVTALFPKTGEQAVYPTPIIFVAFTVDDSPCDNTNAFMDVVESLGSDFKMTFFVRGDYMERADKEPEIARAIERMVAGGHEFGGHSYRHVRWGGETVQALVQEDFTQCKDAITRLAGKSPLWFRHSYFHRSSTSRSVVAGLGMYDIDNRIDPGDWNADNTPAQMVTGLTPAVGGGTNSLKNGQIFVFHDQAGQTNIMLALPEVVHILRTRGVGFLTLSELKEKLNYNPALNTIIYSFN
jgi:peptidoglycan/xylan/chitin deacetylase (PgdA/CDA1 family)